MAWWNLMWMYSMCLSECSIVLYCEEGGPGLGRDYWYLLSTYKRWMCHRQTRAEDRNMHWLNKHIQHMQIFAEWELAPCGCKPSHGGQAAVHIHVSSVSFNTWHDWEWAWPEGAAAITWSSISLKSKSLWWTTSLQIWMLPQRGPAFWNMDSSHTHIKIQSGFIIKRDEHKHRQE